MSGHKIQSPMVTRAQNGSIGEARVRSFLLNRFWVLERSVDIHGADFLIQRRLTARTSLDRQRLGIVQAKYVQDDRTPITIPKDYVIGENNIPRGEFFLIICTGKEDREQMYLLTASDIIEDFTLKNEEFRSPYRYISKPHNRVIASNRTALERIEVSMSLANFETNREYLSVHGFVEPDLTSIDPDLTEPLLNWYGDLPEAFHHVKKSAKDLMRVAEELSEALSRMINASNPLDFFEIYDTCITDYVDAKGLISIGDNGKIWNEDLLNSVTHTREYLKRLQEHGLLTAFPALLAQVYEGVARWLDEVSPKEPFPSAHVHIEYNAETLSLVEVLVSSEPSHCSGLPLTRDRSGLEDQRFAILAASPGLIEVCLSKPRGHQSEEWRVYYSSLIASSVQILLHRCTFGDDEGLI